MPDVAGQVRDTAILPTDLLWPKYVIYNRNSSAYLPTTDTGNIDRYLSAVHQLRDPYAYIISPDPNISTLGQVGALIYGQEPSA